MPIILLANIINLLNIKSFKDDIEKSLKIIDDFSNIKIDKRFIQVLILAEDRRNKLHRGVDTIAILRAIKVRLLENKYQGASTIEQQFIRVVTNRFEKTFYRKLREQILAILLDKKAKKYDISKSYLLIAYYGYNLTGLSAIKKICIDINKVDITTAIEIISRLKYPQPKNINNIWLSKKNKRVFFKRKLYKTKIINIYK